MPTTCLARVLPLFPTTLVLLAVTPLTARADEAKPRPIQVTAEAEAGFLAVAAHEIQLSQSGTKIDYVTDAGQDNLYGFTRWTLNLAAGRHKAVLLYQPLELRTKAIAPRDLVIDDLTFPKDEPIEALYSFPFYRASYMYDVLDLPNTELSFGLSLQIRNAAIEFQSGDGAKFRSNHNTGPVPILKARFRHMLDERFWIGAEADGFYAPVSYLNGSDNEVIGAVLDASVRAGMKLDGGAEGFLNLRYLGGGSVGTNTDDRGPGDGFTDNWLHFVTVSVGFRLHLLWRARPEPTVRYCTGPSTRPACPCAMCARGAA